jgi:hypothetical protein
MGDRPSALDQLARFAVSAWAVIATNLLLIAANGRRIAVARPATRAPEPTFTPDLPAFGAGPPCCAAAVLVGDIDFLRIPVVAWRNVAREIASDLRARDFRVTLNLNATRGDVFSALADRSLKILVVIGHGEKQANTPTVYMRGDDPGGLNQYLAASDVGTQIRAAHGGAHPCLKKVILEACFAGDATHRPLWQGAFGNGVTLEVPAGRTNGIGRYWAYFARRDYGVKPDPECRLSEDGIAPVTGSSTTGS